MKLIQQYENEIEELRQQTEEIDRILKEQKESIITVPTPGVPLDAEIITGYNILPIEGIRIERKIEDLKLELAKEKGEIDEATYQKQKSDYQIKRHNEDASIIKHGTNYDRKFYKLCEDGIHYEKDEEGNYVMAGSIIEEYPTFSTFVLGIDGIPQKDEEGKFIEAEEKDNVWSKEEQIKPEYWTLIDVDDDKIIEFNKTEDKDFVIGKLVSKNTDNKQQEISKYTVEKTLQYKNYLLEDIKNEELPLQKELSSIIGTEIEIDGEKVNINDYLFANLEDAIKPKIDDLISILIQSKYGLITLYYDNLFNQIIKDYKNNKTIDNEKIQLCIEIMNNYYDGVIGINNLFNI